MLGVIATPPPPTSTPPVPRVSNSTHPERSAGNAFEVSARASLFGHDPTSARATVLPRTRGWRATRSLAALAGGLALAPIVGLLPPHVPWVVASLVASAALARRSLQERFTLLAIDGRCPRCGMSLRARRSRLRSPHPVPCDGCHREVALSVEVEAPGRGATRT